MRDGLAGSLKLEQSKVRVITEYMGGGFGAKFGSGVEGTLAANLSLEAKAPVRLMLTRFEQALAVGNRPSSFQKIKLGAAADGTLLAFEMDGYGTAGIGGGGDAGGGGGGANIPAPYLYKVANTRVKQAAVAVNASSARAFRAPGTPPASFGMESAMDDLAVKLGMDPIEFRLKNDPNKIRQREYAVGVEKFGWKEKYRKPGSSPGVVKTGIGCAGAAWPAGGASKNTPGQGADQSRRHHRNPPGRAGHRHRHTHRHCSHRGGIARPQARTNHGQGRRHALSARPRQRRQHDVPFDFADRF